MASLLSPRRLRSSISLRTTEPQGPATEPGPAETRPSRVRWTAAAALGGLSAAGIGWILTAGIAVLGWVGSAPGTLASTLGMGTRLWLLVNGAGLRVGTLPVTVVPWGATAVCVFVVFRFAVFAGRQARADPRARPVGVAALLAVAYLAPVVLTVLGSPAVVSFGRGALVVPLAIGVAALWGAVRGVDRGVGPAWLGDHAGRLTRSLLAASLVLVAGGAAALVWSLIAQVERVVALTAALAPGVSGGVALVLAQLAFAPNAVVWAASYAMGGGFALGSGTLVAPAATALGLLPAVPLLGGLPDPGPGSTLALGWLAVGAVAGAVAALALARGRSADPVAFSALLGGVAGVAAAVLFVGLAWAAGGDLGAARLQGVGPRLFPLLVLAASTLGLAGLATGLLQALLRRWIRRRTL